MNMQDPEPGIDARPGATTPLDFLQAVYCNEGLPISVRLKAATEAAQYVHPKLSVTAALGGDFADKLERAFGRSAKVFEHQQPQALRSFRRA